MRAVQPCSLQHHHITTLDDRLHMFSSIFLAVMFLKDVSQLLELIGVKEEGAERRNCAAWLIWVHPEKINLTGNLSFQCCFCSSSLFVQTQTDADGARTYCIYKAHFLVGSVSSIRPAPVPFLLLVVRLQSACLMSRLTAFDYNANRRKSFAVDCLGSPSSWNTRLKYIEMIFFHLGCLPRSCIYHLALWLYSRKLFPYISGLMRCWGCCVTTASHWLYNLTERFHSVILRESHMESYCCACSRW